MGVGGREVRSKGGVSSAYTFPIPVLPLWYPVERPEEKTQIRVDDRSVRSGATRTFDCLWTTRNGAHSI